MNAQLTATIDPQSFLAKMIRGQTLITTGGQELPRSFQFRAHNAGAGTGTGTQEWIEETIALIASIDNGNDAFKGAIMHASQPRLITNRIVTAYAPARTIRLGEGITSYRVDGSEPFWIGDEAVSTQKSESLPVGLTHERILDERFQAYFAACLVELLIKAGYSPGSHALYTSFGIPNEEMSLQGAKPEARRALQLLFNVPFTVERTDEQGRITRWIIRLVELAPYPQSFGAFAAWYYTIDGRPIDTTIVRHVTLDIGGGQFHDCEVDLNLQPDGRVKLRMSANLLGEGTIAIARAAREAIRARYPGIHLSDAESQQVLLTRSVIVGGHRTRVDVIVEDVISARSQNLFARVLPLVQEGRNFLMFAGGGAALLEQKLREMVMPTRATSQYLFVPPDFAPVLNVVGGYVLAQIAAQKMLATRSAPARRPLSVEVR